MDADVDAWTRQLSQLFAGHKVIVAFMLLAGMTPRVEALQRYGAQRPLLVARGSGTGPLPDPADADIHLLDLPPLELVTDEVRDMERLSIDPPESVRAAVEEYDPDGAAVWWLGPPCRTGELLGRPAFGGRPARWTALEDKTRAEPIWDACAVPHARSRVVVCGYAELTAAARDLDQGDGTVWSGDARDGVNGGADYVRWVRSGEQARAAFDFFAERCDEVRIMPFLDGVPCSIHGFVLDDGVAAFRPVELVMLRHRDTGRFTAGGLGTWWDPPPGDREQMRDVARRVGGWMRDEVGYRGGFGVDGVLTRDGFRPTELNPRFTGGLTTVARSVPDLPLELLQLNVVAGREAHVSAADLEGLITRAADAHRGGRAIGVTARSGAAEEVDVVLDGDRWRVAAAGEVALGRAQIGPGAIGSFVTFEAADGVLRPGLRLAELNVRLLRFADERWATDFGPVEPAPDLRTALPGT